MPGEYADEKGKRCEKKAQVGTIPRRAGNKADDAARQAGTSAARRFAIVCPTFAQVVGVGVHHHGATDDIVVANEGDHAVRYVHAGLAISFGLDVAQVTNVPFAVLRTTVVFVHGIEVAFRRIAAIGKIPVSVHVKTMGSWLEAGYFAGDHDRVLDALLHEEQLHEDRARRIAHSTTLHGPCYVQHAQQHK